MKMLKDCDVEPGDIIELESGYMYECLSIPKSFSFTYKWKFKRLKDNDIFEIDLHSPVKQIIKKDPKKEILQKIEEHKSEIQILENQLKEINRKKMFENLDPNTIYKIIHEDFDIGFIREWLDDSYRIFDITMRLIITIPKDRITEIIPLNEATETYKKLKNLLESA